MKKKNNVTKSLTETCPASSTHYALGTYILLDREYVGIGKYKYQKPNTRDKCWYVAYSIPIIYIELHEQIVGVSVYLRLDTIANWSKAD